MKDLVIVESPTKVKTIKKILGKGFDVKATIGHIKDLPKSSLGVDIENNFNPDYRIIPGKEKVVEELKKAGGKASRVLIATDPDREGEAIAWHVKEEIGREDVYRILIHEITKKGVKDAISNPQNLDPNRFSAQKARRVLDRLVGYLISPLLWDKVRKGLSAGRVQSVAVRLICEREEEIRRFKPEKYFEIHGIFSIDGTEIKAKYPKKVKDHKKLKEIEELFNTQEFRVSKVEKREVKGPNIPPFITSTLQQEAFKRFKFSPKKTMMLAQRLYEGVDLGSMGTVGLITYMRTDSVRVSDEAIKAVRSYIKERFGGAYLPKRPMVYRNKKSSQDAHEAIRPTDVLITPEKVKPFLDKDLYRLYELIWKRFVASQMLPPLYHELEVTISSETIEFKSKFRKRVFEGYLSLLGSDEKGSELPEIEEGTKAKPKELVKEEKETKPPPRYTVSSLIKTLEEKGIGRPSTYATIVSTIQERGYVTLENGHFKPTLLGEVINNLLVKYFPTIVDVGFTASMEEKLDKVEEGKERWENMVAEFFSVLEKDLEKAKDLMEDLKKEGLPTSLKCSCGSEMRVRFGKTPYLMCPACGKKEELEVDEKGNIKIKREEAGKSCPVCGSPMVVKSGRFGRFLACSNYPECSHTEPYPIGFNCPLCGGEVVERTTKNGKVFFSCSNYPNCSFSSWDEPVQVECSCGSSYMVIKKGKRGRYLLCPSCKKKRPLK